MASPFHRPRLAFRSSSRRENSKMTNSNPNHGAKLAAGWALMPVSAQADFVTQTQTQTLSLSQTLSQTQTLTQTQTLSLTLTLGTICARTSRAFRKPRQVNQMRRAIMQDADGTALKSLLPGLGRSWEACPSRLRKARRDAQAPGKVCHGGRVTVRKSRSRARSESSSEVSG